MLYGYYGTVCFKGAVMELLGCCVWLSGRCCVLLIVPRVLLWLLCVCFLACRYAKGFVVGCQCVAIRFTVVICWLLL